MATRQTAPMTRESVTEGLTKANERLTAIEAETIDLTERKDRLGFDVLCGDRQAAERVANIEADLVTLQAERTRVQVAITEGERRIAEIDEQARLEARSAREVERVRLTAERDVHFRALEDALTTLVAHIAPAIALDGELSSVERSLQVGGGRRAKDRIATYVGYCLARAGCVIDGPIFYESYGAPLSTERYEAWEHERQRKLYEEGRQRMQQVATV